METFPTRSTETLENIALIAGDLDPPPGARRVGIRAVQALWDRSGTGTGRERAVAFRLQLATRLAAGEIGPARQLVREAGMRGVPPVERDRWIVLGAVTPIDNLSDSVTAAASASRLERDSTFISVWLAARWARLHAPEHSPALSRRLESMLDQPERDHITGRSLIADLSALELLGAGDPDSAVAVWDEALSRQNLETVVFGVLGSLWPLRLAQSQALMSLGRYQDAIVAAGHFELLSGFVDQVAWYPSAMIRWEAGLVSGDTVRARSMLAELEPWLTPVGARRDSVRTLLRIGR